METYDLSFTKKELHDIAMESEKFFDLLIEQKIDFNDIGNRTREQELYDKCELFIKTGNKIGAIKEYRSLSGDGLV